MTRVSRVLVEPNKGVGRHTLVRTFVLGAGAGGSRHSREILPFVTRERKRSAFIRKVEISVVGGGLAPALATPLRFYLDRGSTAEFLHTMQMH